MDIHIIAKLKSSYEAWHQLFADDADRRSQVCDESRTLVAKANETTAVITVFDVDMEARRMLLEVVESTKTPGRSVGPSTLNITRKLLDRLLWL